MNINNKNISLLSIVVIVGLLFSMAYYTSLAYRDYTEVKNASHKIALIDKLDAILHTIEEEKSYSAIYMGTQQEIDAKNLKIYREKINNEIQDALLYIDKDLKFLSYSQMLEELLINLNARWEEVDALSKDYKDVFTKEYYTKVISSLVYSMQELISNANIDENIQISYYIELLKLEENLNKEESFISFILSSSRSMTDVELLLWDELIKNDVTPNFNRLEESLFRAKLNDALDLKYFSIMGESERGEVFVDSIDGSYSTSAKEWSNVFRKKIDKVGSVEHMIFTEIKVSVHSKLVNFKDKLLQFF